MMVIASTDTMARLAMHSSGFSTASTVIHRYPQKEKEAKRKRTGRRRLSSVLLQTATTRHITELATLNTGNQNVLFEGATAGKCTNGGCFTRKTNAYLKEFKEKAAKQFDGLKCVGMGASGYNGLREIKGAVVLSADEAKSEKVKALIAKEPEKFGFAVVKPSAFGAKAPSAVLVCQDKELLEKQIRKPVENGQRPLTQEEREREQFIHEAEVRALFAEGAKALKSIKKKHLIGIVLALNGTDAAYEAVGVAQAENLPAALAKLSEKDLLRLAWLCAVDSYNLDEEFEEIGVSGPKVRKEARKAALAEWEQALKAKAAEAQGKEAAATK